MPYRLTLSHIPNSILQPGEMSSYLQPAFSFQSRPIYNAAFHVTASWHALIYKPSNRLRPLPLFNQNGDIPKLFFCIYCK